MYYKIQPVYKDYLWGGTKLKTDYNARTNFDIVAESWVYSTHKDGLCKIVGSDKSLKDLVGDAPYLVKFLDSKQALSVQVHPNDEMANLLEKDNGKSEVWYILDHEPNAFIYLGLNREMTPEELAKTIDEGTMCDYLHKIPVQKGDFFYVEAGTIHALGAGITAIEIQQSSNATYRLFDFKRKDKNGCERELHLEKGLKAIDYHKINCEKLDYVSEDKGSYTLNKLVDCEFFKVDEIVVKNECVIDLSNEAVVSITIVEGSGVINGIEANQGDSFLSMNDKLDIKPNDKLSLVVTTK